MKSASDFWKSLFVTGGEPPPQVDSDGYLGMSEKMLTYIIQEAQRDALLHAAEIAIKRCQGDTSCACPAAAVSKDIRAEADKLKGEK